ncbi:hypothetical protein [Streptomyces sp. TR06-5]|uniref:hypothetical protein n=1 Tax=Streptomyces sp. TR06-5 TaxID=3385976 RepID=UPI0039A3F49E
MDAVRVALLRDVLSGTEWLPSTRRFAGSLRASVTPRGGGLLLVGTERHEPWHLAAHLDDEAAWSGMTELSPTLVRHRVPHGAPAHLSYGLRRLEAAGRNETLLVVAPDTPGAGLLERVHDARREGATVLTLEQARAEPSELRDMAHDALTANPGELDLDTLQHLVSAAAGEAGPGPGGHSGTPNLPTAHRTRRFRDRLSRLADQLTSPPPPRW